MILPSGRMSGIKTFLSVFGITTLCFGAGAGPAEWVGDLSPISSQDWNYDRAAHLLERAGFGGTPEEIQALESMTPEQAVRHLVRYQEVKEADIPAFAETGIYPTPTWTRQYNIAAFASI